MFPICSNSKPCRLLEFRKNFRIKLIAYARRLRANSVGCHRYRVLEYRMKFRHWSMFKNKQLQLSTMEKFLVKCLERKRI